MVTMKDIARKVGVSQPTVSLILNSRSTNVRISEATRLRVLDATEKLGYKPNNAARIIKDGRFRRVACIQIRYICEDSREGIYSHQLQYINGINNILTRNGYTLELASVIFDRSKSNKDALFFPTIFSESAVDGLICLPPGEIPPVLVDKLSEFSIPRVWLNNDNAPAGWTKFLADEKAGAKKMTEHLIKKGRKRFVWLGEKTDVPYQPHYSLIKRKEGLRKALQEAGLPPPVEIDVDRKLVREAALRIFSEIPDADALIANVNKLIFMSPAFEKKVLKKGNNFETAYFISEWQEKDFHPEGVCCVVPETNLGEKAAQHLLKQFAGKAVGEGTVKLVLPRIIGN